MIKNTVFTYFLEYLKIWQHLQIPWHTSWKTLYLIPYVYNSSSAYLNHVKCPIYYSTFKGWISYILVCRHHYGLLVLNSIPMIGEPKSFYNVIVSMHSRYIHKQNMGST